MNRRALAFACVVAVSLAGIGGYASYAAWRSKVAARTHAAAPPVAVLDALPEADARTGAPKRPYVLFRSSGLDQTYGRIGLKFLDARQRHPGVESAIGALQSGNGMKRCRDRTEVGFERYLAIAVLGRNLHVLGKILIQQRAPDSLAAVSKRKHVA